MRLLIIAVGLLLPALLGGCAGKRSSSAVTNPPAVRAPAPVPVPVAPTNPSPAADQTPLSVRMVEFHDSGQMLQAIGAANRVIKNGGASVAKGYYIRGSAEGQMGEIGLAVQDLTTATQKGPNDDMAWFTRAWYEYELGSVDQAVSHGEKALDLAPKSSMAWLNQGLYYAVKNDVSNAKRCYESGQRLANRGILAEAMRDIDRAKERYPKSQKTLNQAMKWLTGE
jgi:tetratricopeptide (TPR) repeat protein